jgi:hypothetical protein
MGREISSLTITPITANQEIQMNTTFTAYAASDLYQAGVSCDGHPYIAEKYYVLIENEAGRRFRHNKSFAGVEVIQCEETGETGFQDVRNEVKAIVNELIIKVNAALASGQRLTSSCWFEVDPAYGSDEYVSQGTEAERAFADRQAA